jgi:hypothetical protein
LDNGGLQGGLSAGTNPVLRAAVAVVRSVADEHGTPTNHPGRGRWPGIPSSTEEGSLSSMDLVKGRRHEDSIKEW